MLSREIMGKGELKSTFLIESSDKRNMGTGFCLHQDEEGAYLVTCSHVVEACGVESLVVDTLEAKLLHQGSSDKIDLALVYVKGLAHATPLAFSFEPKDRGVAFRVEGFKPFKKESYLLRELSGVIETVSTIYQPNSRVDTYELSIHDKNFTIEQGYSGSAIICEQSGEVIAVATDRHQGGKQAYAVPISYLKEIWVDMPQELLPKVTVAKQNFIHEVFDSLDNNPLLLFSTDSYNHLDYIETIRDEAMDIFGVTKVIEINCGRFANLKDSDKFFNRLAKRLKFKGEVEDSFDFEEKMAEAFENAEGLKLFILIIGFERLQEEVRNSFAEMLRNLQEENSRAFNLVIFGGQKLIAMKYNDGIHSYFNTFDQKMIPPPSFEEWRAKFDYVTPQIYREVVGVTGGYAKLTEQCFKSDVKNEEEAKILLDESTWKSDLFMAYKEYELCEKFAKEPLGNAHPYSDNKLFYKLYWDNLIVEKKGKFVWRSAFLVEMGREVLGCV
jgi:hypothetical protein